MNTAKVFSFARVSVAVAPLVLASCLQVEDDGVRAEDPALNKQPDFTVRPDPGVDGNAGQTPQTEAVAPPPAPPPAPGSRTFADIDFVIDGGASVTPRSLVSLSLIVPGGFIDQMRVVFADTCGDGEWVPFVPELSLPLPRFNQINAVSVQFSNYDDISQCLTKHIRHDNLPPEIVISKYPLMPLTEGEEAHLIYSVQDASPVRAVRCRLNQVERACAPGVNEVRVADMPEGTYVFAVEAEDELGHASVQQVSWTVAPGSRRLLQNFTVRNENKVDILIVIDNSGSMRYEQQSMAQRVSNFLQILRGLDWRIGVTTTDPTPTVAVNTTLATDADGLAAPAGAKNVYRWVSDGLFLPMRELPGQFYLDSGMNESDAQRRLGLTLQRPETGSGSEQAIFATNRVIERARLAGDANPVQRDFFRSGAHFATVVISDEDESANGPLNDPALLVETVRQQFDGQKAYSWHSIITRPGDADCRSTYGATYGERYAALSQLTGGLVGSVCETDYAFQLMDVANKIRQLVKTLTLTCPPLATAAVRVTKDGLAFTGGYRVEGLNLVFDDALPTGQYAVDYRCARGP